MVRVIRKKANHAGHMIRMIRKIANHANHKIRKYLRIFLFESYDSHVIRCEYFTLRIFLFAANHMFCESCESMIRVIRKIANHANHL